MKRILRTVAVMLVCGAMLVPTVEARGRNERGESPSRTHSPASRPGNQGRGPGNQATRPSRPGNSGSQKPNNNRPGTQNPGNNRPGNVTHKPDNNRPGTQNPGNNRPGNGNHKPDNNRPGTHKPGNNRPGNGNHKPDNNRPGNNRPGNNRPGNNRPVNPGGPIGGHRPDYRPQPQPPVHGNHHYGPSRPNMPPHHAWHRPTPPPRWRPSGHWRPFRSILGITFGTTINLSVNALINSGYAVNSYGNGSVYVSNVPMLNLSWPDAVLYYDAAGGLCGSRFIYSSGFYDMNRYNMAYASLVNGYGAPVSVQNTASGIEATWWGTGNQFIRLSFSPEYTPTGTLRYFTTLSFGN